MDEMRPSQLPGRQSTITTTPTATATTTASNTTSILIACTTRPMDMNWSYFKPELSGKQEEDPEAHTCRTID